MESNFFQRLVNIPLFQGITRDDFMSIAAKIHFDFRTYQPGDIIVFADQPCNTLICTVTGSIAKEMRSDDGRYLFREISDKPTIIQPDRLFGLRPRYSATFTAVKETTLLTIPKSEVRDFLFNYPTIHINYLNFICTAKQVWESRLWKRLPAPLEERFLHFVLARSTRPAGRKELHIGMVDLADELVTTRLNISKMLNELKENDLIYLSRGHIIIPEVEKLITRQQNKQSARPLNS